MLWDSLIFVIRTRDESTGLSAYCCVAFIVATVVAAVVASVVAAAVVAEAVLDWIAG